MEIPGHEYIKVQVGYPRMHTQVHQVTGNVHPRHFIGSQGKKYQIPKQGIGNPENDVIPFSLQPCWVLKEKRERLPHTTNYLIN